MRSDFCLGATFGCLPLPTARTGFQWHSVKCCLGMEPDASQESSGCVSNEHGVRGPMSASQFVCRLAVCIS